MIYCTAHFPKGAGLGTRLFPWARCVIFSHINDVPMLAPRWVQPRVGPLLRGGISLGAFHRQILLLGLFKTKSASIHGLRELLLLAKANTQEEPEVIDQPYEKAIAAPNTVITFSGARGMFESISGWDQFLLKELIAITRNRWLRLVESKGNFPIGINIRLGNDFKTARTPEDYYTKGAIKTPLSWFIESLRIIRDRVGFPAKAIIVSDGKQEDLRQLLELENVVFLRPGCAISDLLTLSRTKVLIASGGSSFSAWASFLGQMPTISHPGQSLAWFGLNNRKGYYTGEFNPNSPDKSFLEQSEHILVGSIL
jgi:hypothetical protein